MATTEWSGEVRGYTTAAYKPALLVTRNAHMTAISQTPNATTEAQYAAALAAADAFISALGFQGNYTLLVAVNGYDSGNAGSGISVSVHKR